MKRILLAIGIFLCVVSTAFAASVTLAWNPNTESDLAGYKIYHGNASRTYSAHVDVPAAANEPKTVTVDIVPEDGRTIYFAATAYDAAGNESDYSNEVPWTVPDHEAPGVPQNFRLTVELTLNDGEMGIKLVRIEKD